MTNTQIEIKIEIKRNKKILGLRYGSHIRKLTYQEIMVPVKIVFFYYYLLKKYEVKYQVDMKSAKFVKTEKTMIFSIKTLFYQFCNYSNPHMNPYHSLNLSLQLIQQTYLLNFTFCHSGITNYFKLSHLLQSATLISKYKSKLLTLSGERFQEPLCNEYLFCI